ncbi:hypothetical protein [Rhizobium sp. G21]|uniref:hypothetical protein n=1 Tax=Rhizobium sp. G21 TaxID=2758439 RepID=UPI001602CA0E|nr:hypothetical protein [Rhizobium sp. G21]MBB1250044.1 hypothetical protein [Rhizobium sp. G21]
MNEKFKSAKNSLQERLENLEANLEKAMTEFNKKWAGNAQSLAPGSLILNSVLKRYGLSYNKTSDAGRIASFVTKENIDDEIMALLGKVSRPG